MTIQFEAEARTGTVSITADWDQSRNCWCFWIDDDEYRVGGHIHNPPVNTLKAVAESLLNPITEEEDI